MAVHTLNGLLGNDAPSWFSGQVTYVSGSSSEIVLLNTDGRFTRLYAGANDFTFSQVGSAISFSGGLITAMSRTDQSGAAVYETLSIPNGYSATQFQINFGLGFGQAIGLVMAGNDVVNGSAQGEDLTGFAGDDVIYGGGGNDNIVGYTGNDTIFGGDGDDFIDGDYIGLAGDDFIDGGTGVDTYDRQSVARESVTLNYHGTTAGWSLSQPGNTTYGGADTLLNIESIRFAGERIGGGGGTYEYHYLALRQAKSNFNFGHIIGLSGQGIFKFDTGSTSDLLLSNGSGQFVTWMIQGSQVSEKAYLGQAPGWSVAATGDFNGDGNSDFLSVKSGFLLNYQMNIRGQVDHINYLGFVPGWDVKGTGDFNNDGRLDIVLQNGSTVVVWLIASNGTADSSLFLGSYGGEWSVATIGDFNGDGRADTLLRSTSGDLVELMTGPSGVASAQWLGQRSDLAVVGSADFNGDGITDILVRDGAGQVVTWITNSAGQIIAGYALGSATGYTIGGTGDYNGDGTSDVMLQSGTQLVEWIVVNGQLSTASAISEPLGAGWIITG